MAKKKRKRTEEPAAAPVGGDLMSELLGQLLSTPGAPGELPVAEMLEGGEIETELLPPAEDTLVALSAAMDEADAEADAVAAEQVPSLEIEPQSLLAMAEVTSTEMPLVEAASPAEPEPAIAVPAAEAEPVVSIEPLPVAELPAATQSLAPPAEAGIPSLEAAASARVVEPAAEPVIAGTPEPALKPEVPDVSGNAAAFAANEDPEAVELAQAPEAGSAASPETASRILKSHQQQTGPAEGGLLDALIGAIDGEIARAPLAEKAAQEDLDETGAVETCAVFSLGGAAYGVPVQNILEIDQAGEVTPVPNVPDFVRGVINLRGEIMCVLDLSAFIGQPALPEDHTGWFMVVQGGRKQQTAALLVDEVGNLVRVPESQLRRPAGTVNDKVSTLLRGTLERNDKILRVLSLDSLFESGELQQLRM